MTIADRRTLRERDRLGRLVARDGRARSWNSSLHGCPARWAHLPRLELVELLLAARRQEEMLRSLAEPPPDGCLDEDRTEAMRSIQDDRVAERARILGCLIAEADTARRPLSSLDHMSIANEIARRTGSPFARTTLRLSPYREILLGQPVPSDKFRKRAARLNREELFDALAESRKEAKRLRGVIQKDLRNVPVPAWQDEEPVEIEWPLRQNAS